MFDFPSCLESLPPCFSFCSFVTEVLAVLTRILISMINLLPCWLLSFLPCYVFVIATILSVFLAAIRITLHRFLSLHGPDCHHQKQGVRLERCWAGCQRQPLLFGFMWVFGGVGDKCVRFQKMKTHIYNSTKQLGDHDKFIHRSRSDYIGCSLTAANRWLSLEETPTPRISSQGLLPVISHATAQSDASKVRFPPRFSERETNDRSVEKLEFHPFFDE